MMCNGEFKMPPWDKVDEVKEKDPMGWNTSHVVSEGNLVSLVMPKDVKMSHPIAEMPLPIGQACTKSRMIRMIILKIRRPRNENPSS